MPVRRTLTEEELLLAQKLDEYYRTVTLHVRRSNTKYSINNRRVLVSNSTVDGATQTDFPEILRARILYLTHHALVAGLPGYRCMYDTLSQKCFWPDTAKRRVHDGRSIH